jgi:hypothetical protein
MSFQRISIICAVAFAMTAPVLADDAMKPMAGEKTYTFKAQNASGETGTVSLAPTEDGKSTMVTIALKGAPAEAQPAHIHMGPCAKLNPKPAYPLKSVVDGKSVTTVAVAMDKLTTGAYAVNVHKSVSDIATYVACADITKGDAMMKPMGSPSP